MIHRGNMNIGLKGNDFLSLKKFDLKSGDESNVVLLLGENKSGKTQALKLLYSFLSALYQAKVKYKNGEFNDYRGAYTEINYIFPINVYNNFFIEGLRDDYSNDHPEFRLTLVCDENPLELGKNGKGHSEVDLTGLTEEKLNKIKKTTAISPNGFGDFYRGIVAAERFYNDKRIFSSFLTDIVDDLYVLEKNETNRFAEEIVFITKQLNAEFILINGVIKVTEKPMIFDIEDVASGLKTFAPIYLAMKHGLIEDTLIIDEPEVSLHPAWIEVMAELLYKISRKGVKVFIATHSDVFIEKMNWFLKHDGEFDLDVWKFERKEDGNYARTLELEDREVPTAEYLKVFYEIVKGF